MENDFRKKMKKIIGDNLDEFEVKAPGGDDAETARKLFEQFQETLTPEEAAKPRRRKKAPLFIPIAAAVLVGIFIGSFLFSDVPAARAFKTNVEQFFTSIFSPGTKIEEDGQQIDEYQSIKDLQADLDFTLPQFTWLPEGYELSSVQKMELLNTSTIISIDYLNTDSNPSRYISTSIVLTTNDSYVKSELWSSRDYISQEINNMPVAISSKEPLTAIFLYHDIYEVTLSTDEDRDILQKIIENVN
ncbi:DUF4367 domain-containing protein [Christensenella intestinihominis]|uniref:DUF4367 domain-containing protein n=1 Tax=Christensenella intestinihominis TaxID=1851429 RepID=UPI0008315CAB|nr:DUF4367 domain-containing protein [Christensenella intestinihominis]